MSAHFYNHGLDKAMLGAYGEAIEDFNQALMMHPDRTDVYYNRRLARLKIGKYKAAIADFNEVFRYFSAQTVTYTNQELLLYSRYQQNKFSLVALNFSDSDQSVPFWFRISGDYREELHKEHNLSSVPSYEEYWITIPSNYGRIWNFKND